MFIETSYDPEYQPKFFSTKELFDHYWVAKRRAVAARAVPLQDQWNDVIQALCDVMTATQQLSVSKEKLNQFPDDYLHQMASEGVLWFDGKRYGFSHESFFDYCFARAFVAKEIPLVEYLVSSEQHLFRRAQVRQVLTYLRDADRLRYCNEINLLLEDARVRVHLKDLVIALVVAMPDPDDDEWKVLVPRIKSEIEAFNKSVTNPDKFSSLVWRHFFTSQSLFLRNYSPLK